MYFERKQGYLAYFTDNLKLRFPGELCMRKCTTVLGISLFSQPGWLVCMVWCCAVQSWQIRSGSTIPVVVVVVSCCVECAAASPGADFCVLQVNLLLAGSEDSLPYFHYM